MPKDEKWKAHKRNLVSKLEANQKLTNKHSAIQKAMEEKATERFQDKHNEEES